MPPTKPRSKSKKAKQKRKTASGGLSKNEIEALVEEAIVDAHDDSEQTMGFFTMLEEHLALPFETEVLGVIVTVDNLGMHERDDVVVVCQRNRERLTLSILSVPLPDPPPDGWQWIEAYRHWAQGWR